MTCRVATKLKIKQFGGQMRWTRWRQVQPCYYCAAAWTLDTTYMVVVLLCCATTPVDGMVWMEEGGCGCGLDHSVDPPLAQAFYSLLRRYSLPVPGDISVQTVHRCVGQDCRPKTIYLTNHLNTRLRKNSLHSIRFCLHISSNV